MTVTPLAATEAGQVSQAYAALQSGRGQDCIQALVPLLRAGKRHPDILMVYALACEMVGRTQEAMGACQAALTEDPERAEAWAELGRMLHESGQPAEAVVRLERAVQIDPSLKESWYNLGLAQAAMGALAEAIDALSRATTLSPDWGGAWATLGTFQQQAGEIDEAERSLRRAVDLSPDSRAVRNNLAINLRRQDRPEEALAEIDQMRGAGPLPVETQTLHAHLLGDQGRLEEAAAEYRSIVRAAPSALDAHETLARLLPQLGKGEEALAAYDEALRAAPSDALYGSALGSAWDLKNSVKLQQWSEQAIRDIGDQRSFRAMGGLGLGLSGDSLGALAVIEPLAEAGLDWLFSYCAYFRLAAGDLQQAEQHALAATEIDPNNQATWAYLTIIWRLMNDEREFMLADYDKFVMPIDLAPPPGFASIEEYMAVLADELTALHVTRDHPSEQSVRGGTQTRGDLFQRRSPNIQLLAAQIEQAIAEATAGLPQDPLHPFLARNTGRTRFQGSWSVRISSGGFHNSHIHQEGWLSSALYVTLPDEVVTAGERGQSDGFLAFGIPDPAFKLDLEPRRIEQPKVGRLMLFPSYFWHGTMPFESKAPRLTVAFDAVPD